MNTKTIEKIQEEFEIDFIHYLKITNKYNKIWTSYVNDFYTPSKDGWKISKKGEKILSKLTLHDMKRVVNRDILEGLSK